MVFVYLWLDLQQQFYIDNCLIVESERKLSCAWMLCLLNVLRR